MYVAYSNYHSTSAGSNETFRTVGKYKPGVYYISFNYLNNKSFVPPLKKLYASLDTITNSLRISDDTFMHYKCKNINQLYELNWF